MAAQTTDLTTLANLKQWLSLSATTDDANLARLISSVSRRIVEYLGHPLIPQTITRIVDGRHGQNMVLPDFPLISFTSLLIDTVVIPAAPDVTQAGWLLRTLNPGVETSMSELSLIGYRFTRGKQNVSMIYKAGFQAVETITLSGTTYNVARPWRSDGGVLKNGVAMTAISSGTPISGQYLAPTLTGAAETYAYTFAAADAGQSLTITYGYTPEAVEQATIEMSAKRYREKDRIGKKSDTLGQQTTSYDLSEMSDSIKGLLQPYVKVIPA